MQISLKINFQKIVASAFNIIYNYFTRESKHLFELFEVILTFFLIIHNLLEGFFLLFSLKKKYKFFCHQDKHDYLLFMFLSGALL